MTNRDSLIDLFNADVNSVLSQATPEQLERQWDIADFLLQ